MNKMIYYTILALLIGGWATGYYIVGADEYIHSLLVMAGLVACFRYVYQLKPVRVADI